MSKQMVVRGVTFTITQRPGYVKMDMNGIRGWKSIWGRDEAELKQHIAESYRYESVR